MITSLTNEKIKNVVKLQNAKYRKQTQLFIVEGPHLIEEAKKYDALVETYTINDCHEGILVSETVMRKMCSTDSICQVLGVCKIIESKIVSDKVLILDDVRDPGNVGALLRSAKSFGFNTVFASKDSVDFYNDKVVRASQGAVFKLNLITGNIHDFIVELKKTHSVYGTNVKNGIALPNAVITKKIALVLGNEGVGIKDSVFNLIDKNIYIELDSMESLNVSIAGSIIMHYIYAK